MENNTNEIQNTPIENKVVEPKVQNTTANIAPVTPVYNNNLANTGVILGTAALTLAAGTGLYFGIVKLSEFIKERVNKKDEKTTDETPEGKPETESED